MPAFVPGRDVARGFYEEVVAPALGDRPHAAAFMGWGSDVLGFDTEQSTDHGWGPRLEVFVEKGVSEARQAVEAALPEAFRGWPVFFGWDEVPSGHHVVVATLSDWLRHRLGFDAGQPMTTLDWLTAPQQLLLEATAGTVFRDDTGELTAVRQRLAWYPDEVWLWIIGCQWLRLSQEEAFVGRTAQVGDDLGSRVIAARVARDVMRMCFLQERRYAPYSKWFGSAFSQLDSAAVVGPHLERALAADTYAEREAGLTASYEELARRHNVLALTAEVDPTVRSYHGRPFQVLHAERFVGACMDAIEDRFLKALPPVGGVDQFVDSTDVLSHGDRSRRVAALLTGGG